MKKISIFLNIILILMVFGNVQGQVAVSDSVELRDTIKFIRPFDLNSGRLDKKSLTAWLCRTTYEVTGDSIDIIYEVNISNCGILTIHFPLPMAIIELHDNKKFNAEAAEGNFSISGEIPNLCYYDTTAINGYQDLLEGVFYINLDDRRVGFYLVEAFPIEGLGQMKVCPDGQIIYQGSDLNSIKPVVETLNDYSYLISWNLHWGGKAKIQVDIDSLNQFSLMAVSDTINHSGSTTIKVRAIDADNNSIDIPEETLLNFSLDANGEKYGSLVAPEGSTAKTLVGITYGEAKAGNVKYIADGEEPDGPKQIVITVVKSDDASINGSRSVVVKGKTPELSIIKPENNNIYYISGTPEMPVFTCRAQLLNYSYTTTLTVNWSCRVSYNYPPGSDEVVFTGIKQFNQNNLSDWNLNFNDNETIIGGKATIKSAVTINGKEYVDSVVVYIRGENPDRFTVTEGLSNGIEALAETESENGKFNQFSTESYATPNDRLPLRGGDLHGWGLCQIDDRWHTITTSILWDWTANLDKAKEIFDSWETQSLSELQAQVSVGNEIPQLVLDCQKYAHYQGGTIAGAYVWDKGRKMWVYNPTNADGNADIVITGNMRYKNNWGN